MAELPLDDFWQARLFCFNESKKGGGGKKINEKLAKHAEKPQI